MAYNIASNSLAMKIPFWYNDRFNRLKQFLESCDRQTGSSGFYKQHGEKKFIIGYHGQ